MKPLEAIRCTLPNCGCECFLPSKSQLRICESCRHGWVTHALDKLGHKHMYTLGMQVEIVQPNIVFDIASLMLYGTQATPIRLKILLDRLFSVLQHDEVIQVLHGFGWSYEDYARGYILQDLHGRVLDKWTVVHREEEHVILQQFLRFGETKTIAQEIIMQDTRDKQHHYVAQTSRAESEIKKFIERTNLSSYSRIFDARNLVATRLPFVPPAARLIAPTALHGVAPSASLEMRNPTPHVITPTPLCTSPLGKLRTMQPFDFRKERLASPNVSPVSAAHKRPTALATCESPTNLSMNLTTDSVHLTPSKHKFIEIRDDDILHTPPKQHESYSDAIDYSAKDISLSTYDVAKKNSRHHRKSTNPVKRQWTPSTAFGSTLISPSGKKRVLCVACNKTFCDKGALKIHYSAVHLKEMHKCTVVGCNMMFSSRRSRNRHSANPNPKLHMPQPKRTKADLIGALSGEKSPLGNSSPHSLMSLPEGYTAIDMPTDLSIDQNIGTLPVKKSCLGDEDGNGGDAVKPDELQDGVLHRMMNRRKCMVPTRCTPPVDGDALCPTDGGEEDKELDCEQMENDDLEEGDDDEMNDEESDSDGICFREGEILDESVSDCEESPTDSPGKRSADDDDDKDIEILHGLDSERCRGADVTEITLAKTRSRKCVACGKKFSDEMELKHHIETVHLKLIHPLTTSASASAEGSGKSGYRGKDGGESEDTRDARGFDASDVVQELPLSLVVNGQKYAGEPASIIYGNCEKPSSDELTNHSGSAKESNKSSKKRKKDASKRKESVIDSDGKLGASKVAKSEVPDEAMKQAIQGGNNNNGEKRRHRSDRHHQPDTVLTAALAANVLPSANVI